MAPGKPHQHQWVTNTRTISSTKEGVWRICVKTGKVPVELSEDETSIIKNIGYSQSDYTLFGFCGKEENHCCQEAVSVVIGSGENGYNNIQSAFDMFKKVTHARDSPFESFSLITNHALQCLWCQLITDSTLPWLRYSCMKSQCFIEIT